MTAFNITITSDTVCPWCYVGKQRLEAGIQAYQRKHGSSDTFATTWKPFYLNPNAGKSVDKQTVYETKFGAERTKAMQKMLSKIGSENGIAFKYGGRTGNTRDSHRLLQLGKVKGAQMQTRVVEELFRAYFEEERDITSHEVLLDAAVKAGLEKEEVKGLLESDQMGEVVDQEVEEAQMRFISGVPHFVVNNKYEIGGAQEADTFVEIFEELASQGQAGEVKGGQTC